MGIELAIIALKCSEKIYLIEKVLHHQNSGMLKFIIKVGNVFVRFGQKSAALNFDQINQKLGLQF